MTPGSGLVSSVVFGVSLKRSLKKSAKTRPLRQHPRAARYPRLCPFLVIGFIGLIGSLYAAEVIPPKPDRYFNDYAHVVSSTAAEKFNHQLADFERETSNQFVVVVYPHMDSDSDIADYVRRVVSTWDIGQKGKRNGVVLAV